VKYRTVLVPLRLPRISDRAAAQLLDILDKLHGSVRHHYADQAWRWQRRQQQQAACRCHRPAQLRLDEDEPF
jgi:hypothetical protein